MKKWQMWIGVAAIVAMVVAGLGATPVLAAPLQAGGAARITLTGQVTAVDPGSGTLQVAVMLRNGPVTYTVQAPAGFDLTTVAIGDTVKVKGSLTAPNAVRAATLVKIAGPEPAELDLTGQVTAIDEAGRTLQVQVDMESGPVAYEVQVPGDLDLSTLEVGDTIHVVGGLVAERTLRADTVEVEEPTPTSTPAASPTPTATPSITPTETITPTVTATPVVTGTPTVTATVVFDKQGFYCRTLDVPHPVGSRIAARYGVPYEQVMIWFCQDRMGFGEIMLALQTAKVTEETPDEVVSERITGKGWGDIWFDRGLIGKNKKRISPTADATELEAQQQEQGTGKAVGPKEKTRIAPGKDKTPPGKGKVTPGNEQALPDQGAGDRGRGKSKGNGRP